MAGLTGGPGLFPGVNVGDTVAIFEQGARHVAKDIAGQGVANPSAALLSAAMMLRHLNLPGFSDRCVAAPGDGCALGSGVAAACMPAASRARHLSADWQHREWAACSLGNALPQGSVRANREYILG